MSTDRISTGDGARLVPTTMWPDDAACEACDKPINSTDDDFCYEVGIGGGFSYYCAECAERISVPMTRELYCTHPDQRFCDCDWCRMLREWGRLAKS